MTLNPTATSVAALDIESFGKRTEHDQGLLRTAMYHVTQKAIEACGQSWDACVPMDRGDCIILLLPPTLTPLTLVTTFVAHLDAALHEYARDSTVPAMRFRLSLNVGYASADPTGWVGNTINHTCRLLDLDALRRVLAAATASPLAVILSDELYRIIVAAGHGGDASTYRSVPVQAKELDTQAWITVPGYPTPPGLDPVDATPAEEAPPPAPNSTTTITNHSEGAMFNAPVHMTGGILIGRDMNKEKP